MTWIVTGASRGLGRQLALQLGARGQRVLALARDAEALAKLASAGDGHISPLVIDLRQTQTIRERLIAAIAGEREIKGLINNAGIGSYKPFIDHDERELIDILQVNLTASLQLTHAVLPRLLQQGAGHIVNIASDLARRPLANMSAYVASKHGLAGFSHSILREVKQFGIKVSLINPGIIDTGFGGGVEGSADGNGSLDPAALARVIIEVIERREPYVIDELTIHPLGQAEF